MSRVDGPVDPAQWLTIPEIVRAARTRMSPHAWDFGSGGAETEVTVRRNRAALEHWALRPRVLRDVSERDTSTTFLGVPLALPVLLAPIGSVDVFDPEGALAQARAAEQAGTAAVVGVMSTPSFDVLAQRSAAPLFLQVYPSADRAWLTDVVQRAQEHGCRGLCLTVDAAVYGRRERDITNRFSTANRAVSDPGGSSPAARRSGATWADVEWLRSATGLPLLVKGITHPADARSAVEHGADVVYVSNHGGRQLDHMLAAVDVLPDVVQAVDGRADVVVDGGFTRGADVLKALCLGARAVLVGKLAAWALGAGGSAGLARALELLRTEMSTAMGTLGVTRVDDLTAEYVTHSFAPPRSLEE